MISVAEALEHVLALARPLPAESVPLAEAAGRWLAEPAHAALDQPPFAASAMDGYAVAGAAGIGARYRVIGEAGAGHAFTGCIAPDEALRIFTGAPLPEGASHVLLQEDVRREGDSITVAVAARQTHVRPRGDDFAQGAAVAPRRLRPQDLALLAAMNVPMPRLRRRPVVAVIATGDELVMPGETPRPDQIVTSNTFALKAMIEAEGGIARLLPIARDTQASVAAVFDLAAGADLVVTVGGASVGDHDIIAREAEGLGLERSFYRIAMRPGKPLMAGRLRGVPMLGLPGNPVSAIVCGHLFLLPLLRAMLGDPAPAPHFRKGVLGCDTGPAGPRSHYMRATVTTPQGMPIVTPLERQDSALLSVLCSANALLIRPKDDGPQPAGAAVDFLDL